MYYTVWLRCLLKQRMYMFQFTPLKNFILLLVVSPSLMSNPRLHLIPIKEMQHIVIVLPLQNRELPNDKIGKVGSIKNKVNIDCSNGQRALYSRKNQDHKQKKLQLIQLRLQRD